MSVERVFCKDKKGFCDCIKNCRNCGFAKGNGVISGGVAHDVLATLFGADYNLDRLRELIEADREGKIFTAPVTVGQTVWFVRDPKRHPENIVEATVQKIVYKSGGAYMKLSCNAAYETAVTSIGKTVFIDEDAANAALKGGNDG